MATTENNYTGSTNTTYSFTFPYMTESDVKVSKNEVLLTKGSGTTEYTQAATSITLGAAPLTTDKIRIYRVTSDSNLTATFYPGSSIRSGDLNDNFTQNLYSTQENTNNTTEALDNSRELSDGVYTSAISIANTAKTTANTADTNATAAVSTANTASTNASNAVTTANTASTNASNAVTTANAAVLVYQVHTQVSQITVEVVLLRQYLVYHLISLEIQDYLQDLAMYTVIILLLGLAIGLTMQKQDM